MRPVSSDTRAPDPQEAANGLLAQPAVRSTPVSDTVLNVINGTNELVGLASNGPDVEQVRALSEAAPQQEELQALRKAKLAASISSLKEILQAIQVSNFEYSTSLRYHKVRKDFNLKKLESAVSPSYKTLSNSEVLKQLLEDFKLFKHAYKEVAYDGEEGKALRHCRGLATTLFDYAEACHDLACHNLSCHNLGYDISDHDPQCDCSDLLQQKKDEWSVKGKKLNFNHKETILWMLDLVTGENALPDELRPITLLLFMDIGSRLPEGYKLFISNFWPEVSAMEHKAAATLLGETTGVISTLFDVADARKTADKLQLIVDSHPSPERRASLLAQMVIGLKKYPFSLACHRDEIKGILELLPENGGVYLRLDETLGCLEALQDDPARKRVESLVKRIVKSTRPLPADEAEALRDWMRSKFSTLENVAELTDLVLCE